MAASVKVGEKLTEKGSAGMKRIVEKEKNKLVVGSSVATSSKLELFYNLISPHTIRRLAKRKTVGALKHGIVNWRSGINDAEFVADRFNHLVNHLLNFVEKGNRDDDEIGGMLWALDALSEVERLCPDALKHVVGISNVFGDDAAKMHAEEMKRHGHGSGK